MSGFNPDPKPIMNDFTDDTNFRVWSIQPIPVVSKNFLGLYLSYLLKISVTAALKWDQKIFKNCFLILAIVNYRNRLDASLPLSQTMVKPLSYSSN